MTLTENWLTVGRAIRDGYKADPTYTKILDVLCRIDLDEARYLSRVMVAATRPSKYGRVWRSTSPDRFKDVEAYLFHRAINWHLGRTGGSLWGPIGDRSRWPAPAEEADTAAQIVLIATGRELASVGAWKKAIYG